MPLNEQELQDAAEELVRLIRDRNQARAYMKAAETWKEGRVVYPVPTDQRVEIDIPIRYLVDAMANWNDFLTGAIIGLIRQLGEVE